MVGTRQFNFTVGPETSDQPTAQTPSADADLMTKGYADANYLAGAKSIKALGDAGYTITDVDGFDVILVGATADLTGNVTVTYPTLADNDERRLRIIKCDTTAFTVTCEGEGAEVVGPGAATSVVLSKEDDCLSTIGSTDEGRWVITSNSIAATATVAGLMSIAAQTFAGKKTFNDDTNTIGVVGINVASPAGGIDIAPETAVLGSNAIFTVREQVAGGGTVLWYNGNTNGGTSGESGTAAVWKVRKDSSSSRSINAAGTINASGADYAEYMYKANPEDVIAKGELCGINSEGKLTKKFSESIDFMFKSTDPSYVGGDTFGTAGMLRTEKEGLLKLDIKKRLRKGEDANELSAYEIRMKRQYIQEEIDEQVEIERKRQGVDRIAFCGQIPVILHTEAKPSDIITPMQGMGDTIEAHAVSASSITFAKYKTRVGTIWCQKDGKHIAAVGIS